MADAEGRVIPRERIPEQLAGTVRPLVFTNGCFDILHAGHIDYLRRAAALGATLWIGLNSDESVSRLKGAGRPVNAQEDRAVLLCALRMVDFVTIFSEDTPLALIQQIEPDFLVKGGDWPVEMIVGATEVQNRGGIVRSLPFRAGYSSTAVLERLSGNR